ncbi:MAG: 1-deoxy-D-xylulose-5-phosphate synthase, partial [Anaplasmataceae bacterium]|nr:1-deoxy-D-xylulose-5-phosphate synthase [Anaplasmataceae bacterium]
AVTFAAGLTISGYKPYCFIYSTFLQRAYDQVVHDVAIQNLPVRFLIDRAGVVGADGMTHAGLFDLGFLGIIPNIYIMVPSDEGELSHMIYTSSFINHCPSAIRYPKKTIASSINNRNRLKRINLGKGYIKISYGLDIAILNLGTRMSHALNAAKELSRENIKVTVADARFAKPFDKELIKDIVNNHKAIIIVEEGVAFFALQVIQYIKEELASDIIVKTIAIPNEVIPHGDIEEIYSLYNMDKNGIMDIIKTVYKNI